MTFKFIFEMVVGELVVKSTYNYIITPRAWPRTVSGSRLPLNISARIVCPPRGRSAMHAHAVDYYISTNISTTGVCEKTLLLLEPWPCNPAAETATQPQIWCF